MGFVPCPWNVWREYPNAKNEPIMHTPFKETRDNPFWIRRGYSLVPARVRRGSGADLRKSTLFEPEGPPVLAR